MAISLSLPSHGLPLPRRFIVLGLSAVVVFLFLQTFAPNTLPPALAPNHPHHEPDASLFSPSKWLPPIFNPDVPDRPAEFDEEGNCLFLSPFDALSASEKARAEWLILEDVSAGIVRSTAPIDPALLDPDWDDEFSEVTNGTRPSGLTHPIIGLLRDGENKWNDLISSQSRTLEEAVAVYERRWGRPPPKGFDHW